MPHVTCELFKMMTGVDLVHVPYRGSYLPDLLSGQMQVAFSPMRYDDPVHQSGQAARPRGDQRDALGCAAGHPHHWQNLCRATRRTSGTGSVHPRARRRKSSTSSIRRSTPSSPILKMKERFAKLGGTAIGGSPAEFAKFIANEIEKWGKVIRVANIKVE